MKISPNQTSSCGLMRVVVIVGDSNGSPNRLSARFDLDPLFVNKLFL